MVGRTWEIVIGAVLVSAIFVLNFLEHCPNCAGFRCFQEQCASGGRQLVVEIGVVVLVAVAAGFWSAKRQK
jgi:hypothetical protein